MPIKVELDVLCRGRGRPSKQKDEECRVDKNLVQKRKQYDIELVSLDLLTKILAQLEQSQRENIEELIDKISSQIDSEFEKAAEMNSCRVKTKNAKRN